MPSIKIMIVEDEVIIAKSIEQTLESMGYNISAAVTSGEDAVVKAEETRPDLAVMDISLRGEMDGIEAARQIRSRRPLPIIFLTAFADEEKLERAVLAEPFAYLLKPVNDRELKAAIEMALYKARIEAQLRESEARWRSLAENAPDIICTVDKKLTILFINRNVPTIGHGGNIRRSVLDFIDPEYRDGLGSAVHQVFESGQPGSYETVSAIINGSRYWISIRLGPILLEDNVVAVTLIARDISDRMRSEQALRESEQRFKAQYQGLPVPTYTWQKNRDEFVLVELNQAARDSLMDLVPDSLGMSITELIPDNRDLIALMHDCFEHKSVSRASVKLRNAKNMEIRDVELTLVPIPPDIIMLHADDVTEKRKAEEDKRRLEAQLLQAHKLQAIGTLAGGIAHDFNNLLAAILGYTELSLDDIPDGNPVRHYLQQVLKSGKRAKQLVQQILSFSRPSEHQRIPLKLRPLIQEALDLLRASLPATIEIQRNLTSDPGTVFADPTQIHQLLMNLCANAAHAMRDKEGFLEVMLERIDLDQTEATKFATLKPGAYHRLSIKDNGEGMNRETLERIFDPFFTTKGTGQGTGMGLAVVHGIVQSHGGEIQAESRPGRGSTFFLYFPLMPEQSTISQTAERKAPTPGRERILFVDDEKALVEIVNTGLGKLGYKITALSSSLEALKRFEEAPYNFDLVITDQTMPGMTGLELSRRMLDIRSDLPIILCTGFSEQATAEKVAEFGIRKFLMKPLVLREAVEAIREVLDGPKAIDN